METDKLIFSSIYNKKYLERVIISMLLPFLLVIILVIIISIKSSLFYGVLIGLFFFIFFIVESLFDSKFYITSIEKIDNEITINFKNKDTDNLISGNISDFEFKVKKIPYKRSAPEFLYISYKNKKLLKQYPLGDWKEKIFHKVVMEMNSLKNI